MDEQYLNLIWQFSVSSKPHLQQLKSAADSRPNLATNKWLEKFEIKDQPINTVVEDECMIYEPSNPVIEAIKYEDAGDILEIDPVINFDCVVEKCLENPQLYSVLANNLSHASIEKLCSHIFNSTVNKIFFENFYKYFLPVTFKKDFSIDLLLKAYQYDEFKLLLEFILSDKAIPINVLQEYIKTLSNDDKTKFILCVLNIELPNELLVLNLFTIYLAYKDCNKSQEIQDFVHTKLIQLADMCVYDKTYGRILLLYIQTKKSSLNKKDFEQLVNMHRSPFKRACINSLNNNDANK